ncbi:MAG: hypothetical protein KIT83_01935 [Bryobacterales bacterium]|nr:hypothetical protein [Bryobacterales bacterium]
MLLTTVTVIAQPTLPPPYQRDGEIYFQEDYGNREPFSSSDSSYAAGCLQSYSRIEYIGKNRRTVGSGLLNKTVDTDGKLIGTETLIANGLLAREAQIRVSIYGNCAIHHESSARVYVNEESEACKTTEDIQFPVAPIETQPEHILRFDAACLRYGVRDSEEAAEPTPKENRIILAPVSPPTIDCFPNCPDIPPTSAEVALKGDTAWWDEQFLPSSFRDYRLEYGEERARREAHLHAMIVEFESLAPIALVHGYTSSVEFWNTHDNSGANPETESDRFIAPLDERRVGYGLISTKNASGQPSTNRWDKKPNISPGPTDRVAEDLQPELRALADRFGADYVNIVSHSMGAIWSRAVIEQLKAVDPSENPPGVLYLVSMSPMHHGSVFADLRDVYAWKNIPKYFLFGDTGQGGFPFWKRMLTRIVGRADASLPDATTWKAAEFNQRQELPEEFRVKGVKTQLSKWTLANSFNENENCDAENVDKVECGDNPGDPDECKRQRKRKLGFDLSQVTNQERSNTLQRLQRVNISQTPSGKYSAEFITQPFPAAPSTAGCPQGRYPLNDFTLRTENMFFRHFNVLPGTGGRPYRFANHSMVGHRSIAEELLVFPFRAAEQSTLKGNQ